MNQSVFVTSTRKLALGAAGLLLFLLLVPTLAFAQDGMSYSVKVDEGYLALRTEPAYDDSNIIGKLYTGETVDVIDSSSGSGYWRVYSPKLKRSGWVNNDYLVAMSNRGQGDYNVKVDEGYLALRTAPAYDDDNVIAKLYTGDTVTVLDQGNGQYWWVYSPKFDESGYVNKDYLTDTNTDSDDYSVLVATNYLALRTAPAYDDDNVIGQLYTGDTVTVERYSGQYWWVYSPKYDKEGYVNKDYLVKK